MATETTQFGVRPFGRLDGDPKRFEVFDRRTGKTIVSGLRRAIPAGRLTRRMALRSEAQLSLFPMITARDFR